MTHCLSMFDTCLFHGEVTRDVSDAQIVLPACIIRLHHLGLREIHRPRQQVLQICQTCRGPRVRAVLHQRAKFCQNRSIGCKNIKIFLFLRWWPSAIFDSFGAYLDHPQWVLGVSITLQNLVMIDAVVFIIWTFQYSARLAGKSLFTPQKLFFVGNLIL